EMFIGTSHSSSSSDPYSIWAVDAEDPTRFRGVAIPATASVFQMSLARDGMILACLIGGELWLVDPVTGGSTHLNPNAAAPQGSAHGSFVLTWSNLVGVVPGSLGAAKQLVHFDVTAGAWLPNMAGGVTTAVPTGVGAATE